MKKEKLLDANGHRKFGMLDKVAYAAGDFGCNMSFALKSTVQTFWLVYMYMEIGLLSALVLVTQIWDAINDPMIGSLIDNDKKKYKMGKFKTYIFVGACGLLIAGALVFLPLPESIRISTETFAVILKSVVFILAYVIWDACYTIANVPYGSMLSLVTEDKVGQAELSTWRSIGSMVGNMVPMIILPMLIWKNITYEGVPMILPGLEELGPQSINPKTGLPYEIGDVMLSPLTHAKMQDLLGSRVFWAALIMGILGFIAFLFMIKKITIRVDENSVKTNEQTEKINIFKSFGKFVKNRPAVGVTLAAMGMFLGMQSATTANTIMFATYFGKADLSGIVMLIGFLPMFFFMPFIKKIVDKYGKKEASVAGTVVSLIGGLIMMFFPLVNNTNAALIVYMLGLVFFGIGMGIYTCVSWAMMGDAIDYNEWKFGTREEGTVYSLHSFFRKLAQGVGPSLVLLIMGALGYVSEKGTVGQSIETARNMCWLVAGLYLFSALVQFIGLAFIYNIDKKTLKQMTAELGHDAQEDAAITTAEQ
ncbi:MAG: MFS transporter [Ruminococcaceae bacterium]|nr:MFS transporter [Oscillospiraceae bacterium]